MQNTNPVLTPPNCPACNTQMKLREKEGSKFWGCPNYKECGGKTIAFGGQKRIFSPKPSTPPVDNWTVLQNTLEQIIKNQKVMQASLDLLVKPKVQNMPPQEQEIDVKDIPF